MVMIDVQLSFLHLLGRKNENKMNRTVRNILVHALGAFVGALLTAFIATNRKLLFP